MPLARHRLFCFDRQMQWVWLVPSLGYGIYIFVTTGQPYGLIFGGFSAVAMLGNNFTQSRREPVDLHQPVRFGNGRVAIGNRVLPRAQWRWHAGWVTRVYQELAQLNAQHSAALQLRLRASGSLRLAAPVPEGLSVWLGYKDTQEISLDLATEGGHALLVGATGSGKSQLLNALLVSACQNYSPQLLRLQLFDFKGGATLGSFAGTPWALGLTTDLDDDQLAALAELEAELVRRERQLALLGASRIQDLSGSSRPPMLLVAIDEAQVLLANPGSHRTLETLAARGRSLGIHLVLTAQSLSGLPRALLSNLGARISVGKADPIDLAQLGFARTSLADPLGSLVSAQAARTTAVLAGDRSETDQAESWAKAILISPKRQLDFIFPSAGLIEPKRQLGHFVL